LKRRANNTEQDTGIHKINDFLKLFPMNQGKNKKFMLPSEKFQKPNKNMLKKIEKTSAFLCQSKEVYFFQIML
jgi:hypothetical protein